jgi:carboxynorspermidine decarboxylase
LAALADHIVFNSFAQRDRFLEPARSVAAALGRNIEFGLRINPEHSEGTVPLYDPCAPGSRLGIRCQAFAGQVLDGISGLHFHTLCEQDAAPLARTLAVVEKKFGQFLHGMRWLNIGGGHHITRPGYDLDLLCRCISHARESYGLDVYLEPGEAVALNAGVLVSTVLDVVEADMPVALLDTSAAAHMPDVLEMPYRPGVIGAGDPGEKPWLCRLAGKSCLAGDVIGEYAFAAPLRPGDRLIFLDMAHYSMVKTTTFNGLGLPGIALADSRCRALRMVRRFGYEDFRTRLS